MVVIKLSLYSVHLLLTLKIMNSVSNSEFCTTFGLKMLNSISISAGKHGAFIPYPQDFSDLMSFIAKSTVFGFSGVIYWIIHFLIFGGL